MKPLDESLDAILFPKRGSWHRRVAAWLEREEKEFPNSFLEANIEVVTRTVRDAETGLRMIVNIPADALLSMLDEGRYLNAYERPRVGGEEKGPSETRRAVDALLGMGDNARSYYFGAVALGGTGVRFYGEYCMALRPDAVSASTQVFDRNCYDLVHPPLNQIKDTRNIVDCLRGSWSLHLLDMLVLKCLPSLRGTQRLLTAGAVSEAILRDEDFVEVHRLGTFGPQELEEIRQSPDDAVVSAQIASNMQRGVPPSPDEILWNARRNLVNKRLEEFSIRTRLVTTSARTQRWR
ncbi:hypothetical protein [Myxococcus xanthus]|uniref:hypothetical protein n=1 Tax=Myxococcus xanthus TaxID=34 RepID=UPI00112631A3|nr:hypothetical protein [Myxococcus xanthus]